MCVFLLNLRLRNNIAYFVLCRPFLCLKMKLSIYTHIYRHLYMRATLSAMRINIPASICPHSYTYINMYIHSCLY